MSDFEAPTVLMPPAAAVHLPHIYRDCQEIVLPPAESATESATIMVPGEQLEKWRRAVYNHLQYLAETDPADRKRHGGPPALYAAVGATEAAWATYYAWSDLAFDALYRRNGWGKYAADEAPVRVNDVEAEEDHG